MKLNLRGHHLLCLKGFQGYGYDSDFTDNMKKVNELRRNSNTKIHLTNTPDDICKHCPNLKNNICENLNQNNKIISMDNEVLSKLNLNKEYDSINLFEKIDEIFNSAKSVEKICYNCMWHDKCLFYQNLD